MPSTTPSVLTQGTLLPVNQGDCIVSADDTVTLSTVLGSCVSACIFDRVARVGGMNHFLLSAPADASRDRSGNSARYGAFAMDLLVRKVLAAGTGRPGNLDIKIFGGGNIHPGMTDIGAENVAFVRGYLRESAYPILAADVGGRFARKVLFHPADGKVFVRRLSGSESAGVGLDEARYARPGAFPAG